MMLGTFTGKKLDDYIDTGHADYVNARRVVNGTDHATEIAGYAEHYEAALKAADFGDAGASAPTPSSLEDRLSDMERRVAALEAARSSQ